MEVDTLMIALMCARAINGWGGMGAAPNIPIYLLIAKNRKLRRHHALYVS